MRHGGRDRGSEKLNRPAGRGQNLCPAGQSGETSPGPASTELGEKKTHVFFWFILLYLFSLVYILKSEVLNIDKNFLKVVSYMEIHRLIFKHQWAFLALQSDVFS